MSGIDSSRMAVGDELADAGAYINGQALTITDELNALKQQLAPLADFWTGNGIPGEASQSAAAMYQGYQAEWNAAAYGLFGENGTGGVLGAIANAMGVVWGNYSDAEWANVQTWQNT